MGPHPRLTLLLLALSAAARLEAAAPVPDAVRRDWYFRESLAAIRDWEDILARWEKDTPEDQRTPILPVPTNGEAVTWPNPIPLMLLPADDAKARVRVRYAGGKMEVERIAPDGKSARTAVKPGDTVVGYQHPGGGGKDHWYHGYVRKFDRLLAFRPVPTPFRLSSLAEGGKEPFDSTRGEHLLFDSVRNITDAPHALTVALLPLGPRGGDAARVRLPEPARSGRFELAAGAACEVCPFLRLESEGGGVFRLAIGAEGASFWLPILTHVEEATAVLRSAEQALLDTPDPAASERLRDLSQKASGAVAVPSAKWRGLFEQASALRDDVLLKRVGFDSLLFVKRKPFNSEQPYMDAHHCWNRPGGGIYRLSPVRPEGKVTPVVDSLGEGIYRDLCLHWDAKKLLFAFGNGNDRRPPEGGTPNKGKPPGKPAQSYHVYEVGVDGTGLRQITSGLKNDCEPFYLPDGEIGFTSDSSEQYVMCGSDIHVANLFVVNPDGSGLRQLSYNVYNDFNPSMLPDGRILYDRWEYNERSVTSLHDLFTMRPDGTMVAPYYGNATIRPNVIMFPRAVPNSTKVTALFTGHHGQTHGPIGLIDVRKGVDLEPPITILTPGVPTIGEKIEDSRHGWFSDPQPLSETTYLCSYTPTVLPWLERSWALYVGDRHGNLALVYRDPEISCAEPVPIVPRNPPHLMPMGVWGTSVGAPGAPAGSPIQAGRAAPRPTSRGTAGEGNLLVAPTSLGMYEAALLVIDVYAGLPGVPRGTARYLRIIEDVPRIRVPRGGVITTSGTSIYTVKRILGIVPIDPDGSAYFIVPADVNVYFEVLDERHREIQRMRSVVCLKEGERRTCVGCHESRTSAPPNRVGTAFSRPPSRPTPLPTHRTDRSDQSDQSDGARVRAGIPTLSYLRDIQPLLNAQCVRCHAFDRATNAVLLTDDLTDQFTIGYQELLPYLSVANAMRWDHPDDVYARPPYTYGSKVSRLTQLLEAGHHDVKLADEEWQRLFAWIDANAVYYDRYETGRWPNRRIFTGPERKTLDDVHARRCARCHGKSDGQKDNWWLSLAWRDPRQSRMLQAPLAKSAGGWGRCEGAVFASADDPDYKSLLAALTSLHTALKEHPREDLLSLRGTAAETQKVELPPPPPPKAKAAIALPEGAVWLSDLKWEKGTAGWTPNKDGLPRLDTDIENKPLRLGRRTYPKGIGTHAPSEIVYRLDGQYARFQADLGGAEERGTVVFQVHGDGKLLYDSGTLHGLREVKSVDVPIAGVRLLRLVVTDAGDGYNSDEANWAGARLLPKEAK